MQPTDFSPPPHHTIVAHCEDYLQAHGDNHLGVGWPNEADAQTRYGVMLDLLRLGGPEPVRVLDFGCGPAHLYQYLLDHGLQHRIHYTGLDVSEKYLQLARAKYPEVPLLALDVLREPEALPAFDYILMNGVLTQKCTVGFDDMWTYAQQLLQTVFAKARVGLAFNVMTKHVDWERDDLFHLPLDTLAAFLKRQLSRHVVFRHDYGLYEYTTYVYREPQR
ncbi:class I SAM-dependent methyltransferase [Hymenobacter weizhouensis]|uniref:class I SAM-dependent methyltransferase n=1 Tax=Hymenobacter sp. YIM 151500-1 TaxID=2987689 RepID=UPI002226AF68|nr:class I SAM-dependent methyltransferase [Hymenobacter sp. YIM 151500-1]UYZ65116.1 class I SAM-dependent methyltransferase [Hymenobacter sp. YIM 151500-1]